MAKFDVMSLFGVNVDFAYFNAFEIINALGLSKPVLKTLRVANLIKKHGRKHHIVSVVIRQVALAELKSTLNGKLLAYDSTFQDVQVTRTDYERQYEAEDKLVLLCYSIALGKSVTSVKRLKGGEFSKVPREFRAKGKSLYDYFRSILNDNTRDYVLSYKEGTLATSGALAASSETSKASEVVQDSNKATPDRQRPSVASPQTVAVPFHKEIERATSLMIGGVQLLQEEVKLTISGSPLNVAKLSDFCKKIIQSYERNPYSLLAARHIQNSEDYIAQHSIACAILACHLSKSLQLDSRYTEVIVLGALLFDIGRFKLPDAIAKKAGKLTEAEFQLTRKHLNFGEAFLTGGSGVPKVVFQMLWEHHERLDGSGYPQGKFEDEISVYGKIGSIVDAYDSLTSEQSHRAALTPTEALRKMQKEAGVAFDKKILALFIKSLGPIPVGSCVALSNGRLGFVLTLSDALSPSLVRQVYSITTKAFISPSDIALDKNDDVKVSKVVLPGDFDLRFIDHIS